MSIETLEAKAKYLEEKEKDLQEREKRIELFKLKMKSELKQDIEAQRLIIALEKLMAKPPYPETIILVLHPEIREMYGEKIISFKVEKLYKSVTSKGKLVVTYGDV